MKAVIMAWITLGLVVVCQPTGAILAQEITLDVGDRLALSVAGLSELDRELTIGPAGTIAVPLLGHIEAAGRSVSEIEAELKQAMPDTVFRRRTGDEETLVIVRPEELTLDVLSYRPITIDGAVVKPGQIEYVHHMTVWHAIAMAGGLARPGTAPGTLGLNDQLDLQLGHESKLAEYANVISDLNYTQALLDGDAAPQFEELNGLPLNAGVAERLTAVVSSRLQSALLDREAAIGQLTATVDRSRDEVFSGLQLLESSKARLLAEEAELDRVQRFLDRNLYSPEQLVSARRAYHQALVDMLEAQDHVTAIEAGHSEALRQISRMETGMDYDLLSDVATLTMKAQQLEAEISELANQLTHVTQDERIVAGRALATAEIAVYRLKEGDWVAVDVGIMDQLQPGDSVSVAISPDFE